MNQIIENIKSAHESLTRRQQETIDPFDLIVEIQDFIQQIRIAGKDVPPGAERELLRSLVQYWGSVYFENSDTGVFPKTELDPFTGEIPPEPDTGPETPQFLSHLFERYDRYFRYIAIGIAVLGVIWVLTLVGQFVFNRPDDPQSTPALLDQTSTANAVQAISNAATESALIDESTRVAIVGTQTALSGDATRLAPTEAPTPEPSETPTSTPSPTPTLALEILRVELTNLKDQDTVAPMTTLKGTYANLNPGWSIHVLIQNITQEGAPFFPSSEFFTVPAGSIHGEWEIGAQFGGQDEWAVSTPYRISFRIATTDTDREILSNAVADGIDDFAALPSTIIPPTNLVPTTVIRNAFENRVVYSRVSEDGVDLYSTSLDGGNETEIKLTGPNGTAEVDPSLSSDGLNIVFVGVKINHPDYNYSIWVMDSTGQNQVEIEETRTFNVIERPGWQPGGNLIVFSERNLDSGTIQVKLLNLIDREIRTLSPEGRNFQNPVWMPNGKFIIASARQQLSSEREINVLNLGLYKIDVFSGVVTEIYTNPDIEISQPALSPDGRFIAFVAYPSNNPEAQQELYILDIDPETGLPIDPKAGPMPLTKRGFLTLPSWDSSGQTIYFQTFERDEISGAIVGMIFAIEKDGANVRRVDTPIRVYRGPVIGLIEVPPSP
jgi:Tol biopolymer transport system component